MWPFNKQAKTDLMTTEQIQDQIQAQIQPQPMAQQLSNSEAQLSNKLANYQIAYTKHLYQLSQQNAQAASFGAQQQYAQSAYQYQLNLQNQANYQYQNTWNQPGMPDLKFLKLIKETELLRTNPGLKELKDDIINAQAKYEMYLELCMPSEDELRQGLKK